MIEKAIFNTKFSIEFLEQVPVLAKLKCVSFHCSCWYGFYFFTARDCGPLLPPRNGSIVGHQTTYPNHLFFHCDEGFILAGSNVRHCREDGKWGGENATCNGKNVMAVFMHVLKCKSFADANVHLLQLMQSSPC